MARRKREVIIGITVSWKDGSTGHYRVVEDSIRQYYKQLDFITDEGNAVAINMYETKSINIASDRLDFASINATNREDY